MISIIEAYKNALLQSGAIKIAWDAEHLFQLRNGTQSWWFVDHGEMLTAPETNLPMVQAVLHYLTQNFPPANTILANVDSKSSPQLVGALAALGGYRQIATLPEVTAKVERGMNTRIRLPKQIKKEDQVVIVDDVMTPNDVTAFNIANLILVELDGRLGEVAINMDYSVLVGLIRNPTEAGANLDAIGVELHGLLTSDDLLTELWPTFTDVQKEGLMSEFPHLAQFLKKK